ncbi:hypothetical protein G5I_02849 [Acromyrmex echinatior]|uniref:Uncharacterized protein n=1 Tax=Acromyrmex echinatior TaxID=103372 RepID=F4WBE1_ACREC|nr:hypothetical protein G5I_02849 [Acromyrmex echinatior]
MEFLHLQDEVEFLYILAEAEEKEKEEAEKEEEKAKEEEDEEEALRLVRGEYSPCSASSRLQVHIPRALRSEDLRYNIDKTLTLQHSTLQHLSNILSTFCAIWSYVEYDRCSSINTLKAEADPVIEKINSIISFNNNSLNFHHQVFIPMRNDIGIDVESTSNQRFDDFDVESTSIRCRFHCHFSLGIHRMFEIQ